MTQNKTYLQDCINRVIDYQKWRRGDEDLQQPHPVELGADLDELIKAAQAYADLQNKVGDLPKRLKIKADIMSMGEKIEWGSDTELMYEAFELLTLLENQDD